MNVKTAAAAQIKKQLINEQILHLRKRNKDLDSRIDKLSRQIGEQRELAQTIAAAVTAADPFPRIPWKIPARPSKPVIPVLNFSDWQTGEKVSANETEGFGEFNWEIQQRRVRAITDAFLRWVETARHGYRIDECRILSLGDLISGDIHDNLQRTNEFPIPDQTAKAGLLLADEVGRIAAHFAHIVVEEICSDNHGRLTRKPQSKQKSLNNMSYLVHVIANERLSRTANVECRLHLGMKKVVDIAGKKVLLQHGDNISSWNGIPYYGLERERAREATKRMRTDLGFDYMNIGHFHVPAIIAGNIIVNGSLPGTNEFDHSCGRHAPPAQVAYMMHPEHGLFNFVAFGG